MNEYTVKTELTEVKQVKRFTGIEDQEVWTWTVYKNGEVFETGIDCLSERHANERAEKVIKIAKNRDHTEKVNQEIVNGLAEWKANGGVPFDNGSGDIEMGMGSHNYDSIQESIQNTPRRRLVEDEHGDMTEEIEIVEEPTEDHETITVEADGLEIQARYDELNDEWVVGDGYETKRVKTRSEALLEIADMTDYFNVDTDVVTLDSVVTTKEISEVYGISDAAVRQAIADGNLAARKSGSTWLVLRTDAEARWNK